MVGVYQELGGRELSPQEPRFRKMFCENNNGYEFDTYCKQIWHVYTSTVLKFVGSFTVSGSNEVANLWKKTKPYGRNG